MFTGIIEEVGEVRSMDALPAGARVVVGCSTVLEGSVPGASIAVNGVCLTATHLGDGWFAADLAPETLRRSNLGDLVPGARVNLERPLAAGGRLSGHIVLGHVDTTATVESINPLGNGNWWLRVSVPAEFDRYLVEKGSVSLDGISLTIAAISGGVLEVTIIPHTYENTNLRDRGAGARINVECDILAKHVEKLMAYRAD